MIAIIQAICVIPIGIYFIRIFVAHLLTWFYFARYDRSYFSTSWHPCVSIIIPVRGLDECALENFRSFCKQNYANSYEIIFCVDDQADPVVPVIQQIITENPDEKVRLVVSSLNDIQAAAKTKNIIAGVAASHYEVIIFCDSDVHVPSTFVQDTIASVKNPEVGLGFSAPVCEGAADWVTAMHNIAVNETVINVAPACFFGRSDSAIGSTMVVRREVIDEIGGLEQFGTRIVGIDISIAQAIHKKGYRIHLLKQPARIFHFHDNLQGWWWQTHRWLVTIRNYYPWFPYVALLTSFPMWWSLLYLLISAFRNVESSGGVYLIAAVTIVQLSSTAVINAKFVRDKRLGRFVWVVFVLDLLRLPVLIHSCLTDTVVWRGRWLHIDSNHTASYLAGYP